MTAWRLRDSVRILNAGGLIAYPTEAVYGLGCDPYNADAVLRLLALKQRPLEKGLILIAAHLQQLDDWIRPLRGAMRTRVLARWPGPVTWLLPRAAAAPVWIHGDRDSIAVRVTDHPLAAALCQAFGAPLVSTSANRGGQRPARTALEVRCRLGDDIGRIVHGPTGGRSAPSEIRDARSDRVVRA